MIELLPTVCRDCGRGEDETTLSRYLDFELCALCIARREREVRDVEGRRAAVAAERAGARRRAKTVAPAPKKPARRRRAPKSKPKR
jgi:hypothetical protein